MLDRFYQQPFPLLDVDETHCLREISSEADAPAFFEYYTDAHVQQHSLAAQPKNLSDAEREIDNCRNVFLQHRGIYWALADKVTHQMIGSIGLYINAAHQHGELCYDLSKSYWHRGLMQKSIHCVLNFAFNEIKLQRIEALTSPENERSIRTLEALDFHHKKTLYHHRFYQGKSYNVELYQKEFQ